MTPVLVSAAAVAASLKVLRGKNINAAQRKIGSNLMGWSKPKQFQKPPAMKVKKWRPSYP
jgi:hypothetical protein